MARIKSGQATKNNPKQHVDDRIGNLSKFPSENPNPVLRVDSQGVIRYANQASAHMLADWKWGIGKKIPAVFRDPIKQVVEDRSNSGIELKADGRWFECTLVYVPEVDHINIYGRDITERKLAEEALRSSEESYRLFMQNFQGIAYQNAFPTFRPLLFQGTVEKLTGYTTAQILAGKPRWDRLIVPEDRKRVRQAGMQLLSHPGRSDSIEYRIRRKDGQIRWVNDIAHSVVGSSGKIANIQGTIYDITESKQVEQSLQASEERFRSLYENATIGMYRTMPGGKILMANPALVQMLGFDSLEELATRDLEQEGFQPGYPREEFKRRIEERGSIIGLEAAWPRKDGTKIYVRESARAIRDQQGKTVCYEGTVEDITERKQAEFALRASEASYRSLFENVLDGIYRTTPDGRLLAANPALVRMLGFDSEEELLVCDLTKLYVNPAQRRRNNQSLSETGEIRNAEITLKRKDGRQIIVLDNARSMYDADGSLSFFEGSLTDITERKRAEEQVQRRVDELEALYESGLALSQALDPKEIGEKIIQVLANRLDWHHAAVHLRRGKSDEMDLLASSSSHGHGKISQHGRKRSPTQLKKVEQGIAGWVLKHGQAVRCANLSTDERYVELHNGMRSGVYVPIKTAEQTIGCIRVESDQLNGFSEDDQRLLTTLSAQAAAAFQNASQFEHIKLRQRELEAIAQVSAAVRQAHNLGEMYPIILDQALTFFEGGGAAISMYNPVNGEAAIELGRGRWDFWTGKRWPSGGVILSVINSGQPFFTNDALHDPVVRRREMSAGLPANACLPLLVEGKAIGSLWVGYAEPFTQAQRRLLTAIADIAATAIHRDRLLARTVQYAEQMAAVNEISRSMVESLDLDQTLRRLTEGVDSLLPEVCGVFVSLYDAEHRLISCACGYVDGQFIDHSQLPVIPLAPPGKGTHSQVIHTKKPFVIGDSAEAMQDSETKVSLGDPNRTAQSAVYIPLLVQGEIVGLLQVQSYIPERFGASEVELLSLVANMAAAEIQNLRYLEEVRLRAKQLTSINAMGQAMAATLDLPTIYRVAYQHVRELVDCPNFGISLFDPMKQSIVAEFMISDEQEMDISLFPPLAYKPTEKSLGRFQAIESGQAIIINNLIKASRTAGIKPIGSPKSPDSAVYTPMIVEGKVIGLLEVQSYHNHAYSNEAREILSMVANQIGLAIQNTRLFHQISQRVEQLSALRSIDMAISASTDLRISLNVVLENTLRHLAVDAADILLLNPTTLTLDYLTGSGFLSNAITRSSMRMGEGLAGRAAFERHPLEIPDLSASQDFSRPDLVTQEGFITYFAVPLLAKGQVRGVLEIFLRRQLSPNEDWRAFLDVLAGQAAIAVDNALLFNNLERANTDLTLAYDATIEGWSQALELRDRETQGHTKRVTDLTMRLARAMQVDEAKLQHVRRGTLLHDIGKMGIPDEILRKPGPLDEGEWEIMRQHPKYAYDMLLPISYLRPALDIPYCHHEKWDGSGYPRGLKGEEIPLPARIFAVVDVFDALTSDRPYREAWSRERALEYIREQTGKHFDPKVAETFLNIL